MQAVKKGRGVLGRELRHSAAAVLLLLLLLLLLLAVMPLCAHC